MRLNPDVAVRFRLDALLSDELTQSEVARRSGVSLNTINAIANNKTKQVSLATLDAICKALEIEPGELFMFEDDRPRAKRRGRG
jgi:putative transcriptional regulator